jgi:hypothetical protein
MSFLTPLFLFGGLAVAAPILFHLIRRTSREKTPFSSIMFLTSSPPRITKRSRLEHLFLLLLRCLVLLLLAAGFARPFMKDAGMGDKEDAPGRRTLILVDTSASMQRAGAWGKLSDAFKNALSDAGVGDSIAVYSFDQKFQPVISFQRWAATPVAQRLEIANTEFKQLKPGWGSTRLGMALARAAALLEEQEDESETDIPSSLVLISDLQTGSDLHELQSFEWPPGMELNIRTVAPIRIANAGLQYLPPSPGDTRQTDKDLQKVRVYNAGDSDEEQFQISWLRENGEKYGLPTDIYVPPGQSRVVALERPTEKDAASRLGLLGDVEKFDNQAWLIPPAPRVVDCVYVGGETPENIKAPLFFVKGALQDSREHIFRFKQFTPRQVVHPAGFTMVSEAVSDEAANSLREFVEAGGTILLAPRDVAALTSMFQIFRASPLGISEEVPARYALFGEIDFEHPLFAYFADPRFSDFSKIHFWKYRKFPAESLNGAHVLARFDNDDPALVQVSLGKGTAFVLAASWYPSDSQLALSTKFVPLLHSMLELSGILNRTPQQYLVGTPVAVPFTNVTGAVSITLPDGKDVTLSGGATSFEATDQPGLYAMSSGTNTIRFAVNVDPRESRTDVLAREELEQFGVLLGNNTATDALTSDDKRQLKNAELEGKQKLWRWLIVAALVVLSLEILAAGRLARPATSPETAT